MADFITARSLRDYLDASEAWPEILAHYGREIGRVSEPPDLPDELVIKSFSGGALANPAIMRRVHQDRLPNLAEIGRYGDPDLRYHLGGGLAEAMRISRYAAENGYPVADAERVLDFGCGTSRVLRYFVYLYPECEIHGADVFGEAINWGRNAFPTVEYSQIENLPPTALAAGSFPFVYAFSIFTHYEESTHLAWIKEIHRVMAKHGVFVLTATGDHLINRCEHDKELRTKVGLGDVNFSALMSRFRECGYVFVDCYDPVSLAKGGLDASIFGKSFISRSYIEQHWSPYFDCLAYHEGVVAGMQDYLVLKKK